MRAIIFGKALSEFCLIKKKHYDKHFFRRMKQLYWIPPHGLSRCRVDRWGDIDEEEIIVYGENEFRPYQMHDIRYTMDELLMEIDAHKGMTGNSWFSKKRVWFTNSNTGINLIGWLKEPSSWGIILAIIIIAPMFLKF